MNLFYTDPGSISGGRLILSGQEAQHAGKVLRHREGDGITVTDGQGSRITGRIISVERQTVLVEVVNTEQIKRPFPEITLAVGLIKKRDRLEFAVEKAVELGVRRVFIFTGDYSEKRKVNLVRLRATALSAMKQSLRYWSPVVTHIHSVEELLKTAKKCDEETGEENIQKVQKRQEGEADREESAIRHPVDTGNSGSRLIVADETVTGKPDPLSGFSPTENMMAITGPEGGFSDPERELLRLSGAMFVSLGPYRLRTETAAVTLINRLTCISSK